MKPSIYLEPAQAAQARTPAVPPGTNVIVIQVESLSSWLLHDDMTGVRGLTPFFDDFAAHSFTFRNLYSADFPTIKGQLATYGSFMFDHRGLAIAGDAGNPLKSRFLYLSDVLKARGYDTIHAQSDYGTFEAPYVTEVLKNPDLVNSGYISASYITNEKNTCFASSGFILKVPARNIFACTSGDGASDSVSSWPAPSK
jgi:hypothetical protein